MELVLLECKEHTFERIVWRRCLRRMWVIRHICTNTQHKSLPTRKERGGKKKKRKLKKKRKKENKYERKINELGQTIHNSCAWDMPNWGWAVLFSSIHMLQVVRKIRLVAIICCSTWTHTHVYMKGIFLVGITKSIITLL